MICTRLEEVSRMRIVTPLRPLVAAVSLGALLAAAPACSKKTVVEAEANAQAGVAAESFDATPEAIVEENDNGSVAWAVAPTGEVKAVLKTPDGKPITKNVTGNLVFRAPTGETRVPVTVDAKTGVLVAAGPKLEDDITPISYDLIVDNKPWTGTLHIPRGGTIELAESAKVEVIPPGKVGPNGGVIQMIGPDRVEVVAQKTSGQVRVYFLDPEFKVIAPPADHKVKIALVGDTGPEVVVLNPAPQGGLFFVGSLGARVDPVRLTIAIATPQLTRTAIIGYAPHAHLIVGARAPRVHLLVADTWDGPDVEVVHRHRGHDVVVHEEVAIGGPSIHVVPPSVGVSVGVGVGVGVVGGGPHVVGGGGARVVGVGNPHLVAPHVGAHVGGGVHVGGGAKVGGGRGHR
jgi:hypothetical protein